METWLYGKLKESGLTQKELAKRLGISEQALYRKFSGKNPFLYREVVKICNELKIDNPLDFFR